jgi:polyferredoxin
LLWYGFGYGGGVIGHSALYWFVIGNLLYYLIGIGLAYALKDRRAFCKYLCPVSVLLKLTSGFSLIKVKGDPAKRNACNACIRTCPMDIRIPEYIINGERVLSTECSLCQTCISICPRDALKLSFGLEMGGRDLLREQGQEV